MPQIAAVNRESKLVFFCGASVIFLAILICYLPIFHAGFIWDDNSMLTENPFVKARDGLRYLWFSTEPVDYFPLTYTSLWLEWRFWGMNALVYHVTNLLLHAMSSVLLWRIFKQLNIPGAWLAALIFAIHPVNVESVAWIAERKNTLCLFFYLLSLLFFLRSEKPNVTTQTSTFKTRNFQYGLSLIFFLLALLSKTSVVMLPFVLLLCFLWQNRKISMRNFVRTIPFFVLSLALGLATVWFQHHRAIADDVIREANFWTRFGDAGMAIWFYLWKAIFPARLSFVYPQFDPRSIFSILAWLAFIGCLVIFWWKRRSWGRHFIFALGYFVLMLLPILGFLNIYFHRYSLVADHWQYFALPGIIALFVSFAVHFLQQHRVATSLVALTVVVWFGIATSRQTTIYKNSETLWRDTLIKNPSSWLALNNLGLLLTDERKSEAILLFEKSLRLQPDQIEGYNNLGTALLNHGKLDEAMSQYQQALKRNPNFALTHYNIANVLDHQDKTNEAMAEYREALRLDPDYVDAHNNLGCMLVLQGKMEEGTAHFREALRVKPDNVDTLNNLASTLTESGEANEAIPLLSRALQIRPNFSDALYNLGNAYLVLGQNPDAINAYAAALKNNPQMPLVHYKMGNAYYQMGKGDEALVHFLRALELNPNLAEAHYQAAVIFSTNKNMDLVIVHYNEAIRLKRDWIESLNNLAWILATNPEEKFRDGKRAVELAERAVALTESKNPGALDTLAAAYAEQSEFSKANDTATKAIELATSSGDKNMTEQIGVRLKIYRAQKPFRE